MPHDVKCDINTFPECLRVLDERLGPVIVNIYNNYMVAMVKLIT